MYVIIGTIIGALFGAFITHISTKKLFFQQRLLEASAAFRESFFDELVLSKTKARESDDFEIIDELNRQLPKHNKAIIRFRPFVPKSDLDRFDQACAFFTEYENRLNVQFVDISGIAQDTDLQGLSENQIRGKVKSKIERVFEFAPTN